MTKLQYITNHSKAGKQADDQVSRQANHLNSKACLGSLNALMVPIVLYQINGQYLKEMLFKCFMLFLDMEIHVYFVNPQY